MADSKHLNPRDAALYLATIVALYWSLGSLVTLLFHYIDYLLPDEALQYFDPYSGPIRFAMASLIIVVPVFIALTRMVNQDLRKHPEKREMGLRKWLLYLTVLIGGVIIIGDLIALVNNFLGGELTTPFLLKVATLLVVVGGAFLYYFADLKGYWGKREQLSIGAGAVFGGVVLVSLIAGFFILGSPQTQRELRLDQERISDLQQIEYQLFQYWSNNEDLPDELSAVESNVMGFTLPRDPESDEPYAYERASSTGYELCATFAQPTPERARAESIRGPVAPGMSEESWSHPAGEHCFERNIDPDLVPRTSGAPRVPRPIIEPVQAQ